VCKSYIDHRLSAEGSGAIANSSAWKDRENYKRDLIHLGWIIAYETERVSPEDTNSTILNTYVDTLRREKQRLCQQLALAHQLNEQAMQQYKELYEELELE
jgi:transcription initiation factor TFIIIB Brf1 subunit/transcription initiation factor TFIIB